MALNIKDGEADRLVRELAGETGESLTTSAASAPPVASTATRCTAVRFVDYVPLRDPQLTLPVIP